jgi:hypothetical protein
VRLRLRLGLSGDYLSTNQYKVKTRETGDRLAIELENWVEFWRIEKEMARRLHSELK